MIRLSFCASYTQRRYPGTIDEHHFQSDRQTPKNNFISSPQGKLLEEHGLFNQPEQLMGKLPVYLSTSEGHVGELCIIYADKFLVHKLQ